MKKIIIFLLILTSSIFSTEIFVGSGETYTTVTAGVAALSGADTLTIRDGTYYGAANRLYLTSTHNGSGGVFTLIRAENDWGVTINLQEEGNYYAALLSGVDSVQVRGIVFTRSTYTVFRASGDWSYIYLKYCGFTEPSSGNRYKFAFDDTGDYGLVEDCFGDGYGRYSGSSGQPKWTDKYLIVRRYVVRQSNMDNNVSGDARQTSNLTVYQQKSVWWQNVICVDSNEDDDPYTTFVLMTPNGAKKIYYWGCIQVNCVGTMWYFEGQDVDSIYMDNNLVLGAKRTLLTSRYSGLNSDDANGLRINNLSIFDAAKNTFSGGIYAGTNGSININNSIFYQDSLTSGDVVTHATGDSILMYQVSPDDYDTYSAANITGQLTSPNPMDSYTYPTYPDAGSWADVNNMGCDIQYRTGLDGTFHGDVGWDSLTTVELFPLNSAFNNAMKRVFKDSLYHTANQTGDRGWAATELTLGEYIMEWFGNDFSGDNSAPTYTATLTLDDQTDSTDISITSISSDLDTMWISFPDSATGIDTVYTNTNYTNTVALTPGYDWRYLFVKAKDDSGNVNWFNPADDSIRYILSENKHGVAIEGIE